MRRIIGRVRADIENGEGFFNLNGWFQENVPPISRADILEDIKLAVDAAYDRAIQDMMSERLQKDAKHLRETKH